MLMTSEQKEFVGFERRGVYDLVRRAQAEEHGLPVLRTLIGVAGHSDLDSFNRSTNGCEHAFSCVFMQSFTLPLICLY